MKRLSYFLGLYDNMLPIENKVFNLVSFTAFFINALFLLFNLLLDLSWLLNVVVITLGSVSLMAFYLSRYKNVYRKVVFPYLIFGLISLVPVWFLNGGIEGSTLPVFIFLMSLGLLLVAKKHYVTYMLTVMICVTGVFLLEDLYPALLFRIKTLKQNSLTYCRRASL
jgi:hypothetical protein